MSKKVYESSTTKQTMNRVKAESMPFDWSINPYRGCAHGCSFCYARAFQAFIGREADDDFQNRIMLKTNAAEALESQLSRMAKRFDYDIGQLRDHIGLVTLGTATDPYQPIEIKSKITRSCLEVLAKYRIRTTITTRSPLILRDLDLLTQMDITSVNISLNTLEPAIIRMMEPGAPLPYKRLQAMQKLSDSGVRTGLFIAPILPFLTDSRESLRELMTAAKEHHASFTMTSLLRLTPDVKSWFLHSLGQHHPQLVPKYKSLFRGAYPDNAYADRVKALAREIKHELQLSGEVPEKSIGGCKSGVIDDALTSFKPSMTLPTPEVEQLSFPF
ncbi:radical SAM protein [Paenibacillus dokdonensis]|uniref:Radical SAM protein n=1 Tax=Paenibacillus dokdonensis TaxID=2567944 RepID=A0ABU6GQ83_9BACL|nr:radical SAM protein [Paenibacillus dokdonensis]MEC0241909.1 radical SAM protein [Paenibacillus dokdonensis]